MGSPLEFERLRRFVAEGLGRGDQSLAGLTDLEIAKALGVVMANHTVKAVLTGALLLFGREEARRCPSGIGPPTSPRCL